MRKLKLQMQVSLDGFNSTGPNDEQTWVTRAWDELRNEVLGLLYSSDTILIGRKLAVDYIPYWQDAFANPEGALFEVAKGIVGARKIVFTKTLDQSVWDNTELAKGLLKDEIRKLKSEPGKDIIVYGGSSFVSSLITEGLIDQFYFFVNPVVVGKGVSTFAVLKNIQQLKLIKSITYPSGIVLLNYEVK